MDIYTSIESFDLIHSQSSYMTTIPSCGHTVSTFSLKCIPKPLLLEIYSSSSRFVQLTKTIFPHRVYFFSNSAKINTKPCWPWQILFESSISKYIGAMNNISTYPQHLPTFSSHNMSSAYPFESSSYSVFAVSTYMK